MQSEILSKAKLWAQDSYFDEADRAEIQKLIDENNEKELDERFYKDLEFGTGGLRSILGIGSNRMNKYNVRRATQAMANTVIATQSGELRACVSHDSRNFSKEFAREVASVFAANGIKTYIYKTLTPVPYLSYSVRHMKAHAGVMITASHNPPKYNGFKAFWGTGAQVTPPYDQKIIDQYNGLTNWNDIKFGDFDTLMKEGMIEWMSDDVVEAFNKIIESRIQDLKMCKEHGSKLNVVYTAIHGTGEKPCKDIANRLGFTNFNTVAEQAEPNGDFPTVVSPNPEEPKALELAIKQMKETHADLVMGTDPDTDRLGVAYIENGETKFLNGNQIAVLMLHYVLEGLKKKNQITKESIVLKSIVTSQLQDVLCNAYGVKIQDTLTGFKWMGKILNEMDDRGEHFDFVFASEESFGYMGHADVRDKDGVCAVAQMLELTLFHKLNERNLTQALDLIYKEFGFHQESLVALVFEGKDGQAKIGRIMDHFRNNRPAEIAGDTITEVSDYKSLTHTVLESKEVSKLDMVSSNVLGFRFASGNRLFLRPSGTEPKIKFYTMVQETEGDINTKKQKAYAKIEAIESWIREITKDL